MHTNTNAMGWTGDGDILSSDNKAPLLSNGALILNLVLWHMLTEPGEYSPAPSAGMGLLNYIGISNLEEERNRIQQDIDSYFEGQASLFPFRIKSTVTKSAADAVEIKLFITGPDVLLEKSLLVDIHKGRITNTEDFLSLAEQYVPVSESSTPDENVNPFLKRIADNR